MAADDLMVDSARKLSLDFDGLISQEASVSAVKLQ
jgi:hypothetical protein